MPIETKDCDRGSGSIIVIREVVTDQELMETFKAHLTQDEGKFKKYKYILFDHTSLTKMDITHETVECIAGMVADTSKINPDPIVAVVANVSIGANLDHIAMLSKIHALFVHRSYWETMVFRTRIEAVRWIRKQLKEKFGINDLTFN